MNAKIGIASLGIVEIERAGPERVVWPAFQSILVLCVFAWLAPDHGVRWPPPWPFGLARYRELSGFAQTFAPYPDPVADRHPVLEHEIKEKIVGNDVDIAFNPVTTTGVYQLWFEPFGQFDFVGPGSCGQKATRSCRAGGGNCLAA